MTVEEMKAVDIRTVRRDELVDIRDVVIDQDASKEERIKSFLRQIRNPYCFKVGNVVVKTTFADTDVTLDDQLEHYFRNKWKRSLTRRKIRVRIFDRSKNYG